MRFVIAFTLTLLNIVTGCELPKSGQNSSVSTTTTTVQPANMCDKCDYNALLKTVNVPDFLLPTDHETTTVNGCLQTQFECRNQNGEYCDLKVYVTNSNTQTTVQIATMHDNSIYVTKTCGANGFYVNDGVDFDGYYCTMSNCGAE